MQLDDAIELSWGNKDKKKMSALNQKGLSTMKQKLRKAKAQYETEVNEFRQKPVDTDQSEEERTTAAAEVRAKILLPSKQPHNLTFFFLTFFLSFFLT